MPSAAPILRKAVLPVAGAGTRFLPVTKAVAKELLPVVDRPLVSYAVEEAVAAGVSEIIFITAPGKPAIQDYFSPAPALEALLAERGETHRLEVLRAAVPAGVRFSYVQQDRPLGLGHAVACARALVGEEPFAVLLPDELLRGDPPCLAAMATAWRRAGGNCVAALEVPAADVSRYGVIAPAGPANDDGLIPLAGMVEKPAPEDAPSNLMLPGRYILQPRLFHHLAAGRRGAGGEIQLTDAMAALLAEQPVFAYRFDGQRFDCGGKAGFLAANLALALERPELAAEVRQLLAGLTPAADA